MDRKKGLCAAILLLTLVWSVGAAGAQERLEAYVPAGYELTVRVNLDRLLREAELEPLRNLVVQPRVEAFADKLFTDTGIDLLSDFSEFVVAGVFDKSKKKDGLIILRGKLDDQFISNLFAGVPSYTVETQHGKTIHGFWSEEDSEMRYACMLDKQVFSLGRYEPVLAAAALGSGAGKGLMDHPDYALRYRSVPKDAIAAIVALPPAEPGSDRGGRFVQEKLKAAALWLDGKDTLQGVMELTMIDAAHGAQGVEILEGAVAFGQMAARHPLLQQVLKSAAVSSRGASLKMQGSVQTAEVSNLLAALRELKDKRRQGR